MKQKPPASARRPQRTRRMPDFGPWPPVGYVGLEKMMAAVGVASPQTIYSHVQAGYLPAPQRTGPNRIGWPVEQARQAIAELPNRVGRRAAR